MNEPKQLKRRWIELTYGIKKTTPNQLLLKIMDRPIKRVRTRKKDGTQARYNLFYFVVSYKGREQRRFASTVEERDCIMQNIMLDFLSTGHFEFQEPNPYELKMKAQAKKVQQ